MSKRSDRELLQDMLESIDRIQEYIHDLDKEAYLNDRRTIDAVVRNLEIIGEAANRLKESTRDLAAGVEWYKIIGLRNRIVHGYFDIDSELIWDIIKMELLPLHLELSELVRKVP